MWDFTSKGESEKKKESTADNFKRGRDLSLIFPEPGEERRNLPCGDGFTVVLWPKRTKDTGKGRQCRWNPIQVGVLFSQERQQASIGVKKVRKEKRLNSMRNR